MAADGILEGEFFINGDEACAEGGIAAGCRFFAGYPITPAKVAASLLFSTAFVESNPGRFRELLAKGMESPASPQGFRRQAQATMSFDTFGQLPHIQVPTLVIAGTEDSILPAENSRILASRIPNAELLLFEGVGHGYVWEAADKANRAVLDFLRRQRKE